MFITDVILTCAVRKTDKPNYELMIERCANAPSDKKEVSDCLPK